jgi:MFS family permease
MAVAVLGLLQVAGFALVDRGLHRPVTFLAVVFTAEGLGSIAGGLTAPAMLRRLGEPRVAGLGLAWMGAGVGAMALADLPSVLIGAAVAGAGFSAFVVAYTTLLQRTTATELQGRVFTAAEALAGIPYCGTLAVAAVGVSLVGYRAILVVGMLTLGGAGAYLAAGRVAAPAALSPGLSLTGEASVR